MNYSRQEGWFNPSEFKQTVHVIGCGATGSFVAMQLVKMGVRKLHVYDFDVVEEHNVANQIFSLANIGQKKVDAFKQWSLNNSDELQKIVVHDEKVTGDTELSGIVFVLTDTMESRREIWEGALRYNPNVELVIETRMSVNCGRVYTLSPMKPTYVSAYEGTFYEDEEAEVSFCGSSLSIVPTAMEIASRAVWKLLKYSLGKPFANEVLIDLEYNNLICTNWKEM